MSKGKKALVIGSGVAGMSAASVLAKNGYEVRLIEKNSTPGGRCRVFEQEGFVFDMGPSWFWMPDVYEKFFAQFGYKTSDLMELKRLDPSYKVFFEDAAYQIPASLNQLIELFERIEIGAGKKLEKFLADAAYKYKVGMQDLVYKPSLSVFEFLDIRVLRGLLTMNLFSSISSLIKKYFSHPHIIQLLEFPVLFLGAKPQDTPALYSLMNYADMVLGTWYPMGGMGKISEAFHKVAVEQGVNFSFNEEVISIKTIGSKAVEIITNKNTYSNFDVVISGADYYHTDRKLLHSTFSNFSEKYWNSRELSPSSLLFYVGVDAKIPNLEHHNLFFDADFSKHAEAIYDTKTYPENPLFYVCCPSKTDPSVAPSGKENLFFLMPIAPGIEDNEEIRENYFQIMLNRLEQRTGCSVSDKIIVKKSFSVNDFISAYNSYKGNAYGLANTLRQTAILKPSIRNKKVKNLFYTGQLTVPGPGLPPSIISGQIVANYIIKNC